MTRSINFIGVLLLLIMAACTKDENNFSYGDPVDIVIADDMEDVINIRQGDSLILTPQVNDTGSDYSYLWFAFQNNSAVGYNSPKDTLSTEKELRAVIDPTRYILGEPYRITFKVTDNTTGVSAFYFYNLRIANTYTEGWLVMEDVNGQTDLSMLLPDGEVIHHIYSTLNPDYPMHKPLRLGLSRNNVADAVTATGRKFYLVSEEDAIEMDVLTMRKRFDYNFLFFQAPAVTKPTLVGWSQPYSDVGSGVGIIVNEGLLCTNFTGGFPGAKKFGLYMQAPEKEYDYEMAPFFASAVLGNQAYQHIMYDQKNKCFYNVSGQAISAFSNNASSAIFDMNNVGLSMIHMDRSNLSNSHNAIMKDESGAVYLLQFSSATTTADPVITKLKQTMNAPLLVQATSETIASSNLSPHIFYGHGNTLYRYEINSNTYQTVFSFPGNEHVSNVKFRALADGIGQLVVAVWNGQESKLYDFSISQTGMLEESGNPPLGGFARVVDMVYKNAN